MPSLGGKKNDNNGGKVNGSVPIVTAREARRMNVVKPGEDAIIMFNYLVQNEVESRGKFKLCIPFNVFGPEKDDIQFIENAGFQVTRQSTYEVWVVTIPPLPSDFDPE